MKTSSIPSLRHNSLPAFLVAFIAIFMISCASEPEPLHVDPVLDEPEPVREEIPESPPEPEALDISWPGTVWIMPIPRESGGNRFPGYSGFYLAEDGRLLLLNYPGALGDTWEVDGNRMHFQFLQSSSSMPLSTTMLIHGEEDGIRLVPEGLPTDEGIRFIDGSPTIDLEENHWNPKWLAGGEQILWPASREIHLILLPDARRNWGILGYGGVNRFNGTVVFDGEHFQVGPIAISRMTGPAIEFENLYVQQIRETTRYVQAKEELFLFADTEPVAGFRMRFFD